MFTNPRIRHARRSRAAKTIQSKWRGRRGNMKKTTRKGAYAKPRKSQMIKRRAPLVETKRKTYEDLRSVGFFVGSDPTTALTAFPERLGYLTRNEELFHMNPWTFYWWSQGLSQPQHIGQSVLVRHLNQKIQVRFPQPHMQVDLAGLTPQVIPTLPQNYTIYWGWIPAPRMLTGHSTPTANTETVASLDSYVNNRLKDYFNDRKDRLRFIPKKDSTIRIIGSKKVRPDLRFQSSVPPGDLGLGVIPDYFTEISWKFKGGGKKIWLEQSGNLDGGSNLIGMYPNYAWLPFSCLINWNYSETKITHPTDTLKYVPSISCNDIVYFTDS